ncbi:MAG: NusA-like transcription termination signal-binding factor [Candidatus Bathyarchaeota archaeon]
MSSKIKITADEMRYIALFESITGATTRDCLIESENNRLIFVTKEKEAGLAVGKNGSNVKVLKKMTGKNIQIIEYAADAVEFIKNAFSPAQVKEVRIMEKLNGQKIAVVSVEQRDKGVAIGKSGEKAERVRNLAKRYFGISNIIIA